MKILILGGYGVFGGRLAQLLSDLAGLEILICGRSLSKAQDFCSRYEGAATVKPVASNRDDVARCIAEYRPDIVVDASGPFQDYGDNPYIVVKACMDARTNYLDFADAADFVFGISQFDDAAKAAGIYALSGVSSFPVLTAAVLREMATDMEITSVIGGIAPSPYAGIGLNVMRAVVSYAGSPVKLLRNGKPDHANGLAESIRYTIAAPGHVPLRNIHFSLVDVPDLQVIPPEYATMTDIWMGAGPVPEILHRVLNLLAKARAALRLPSFEWMSPFFYWVLNLMKFGEHRGGMFVEARGTQDGHPLTKSWHLLAEGDDGPFIPSMAIEAIVRKAIKGEIPENGARPATHALKLSDYDELFSDRSIFAGMRSSADAAQHLYSQLLGDSFARLPTQIRKLHTLEEARSWAGEASVTRGKILSRD